MGRVLRAPDKNRVPAVVATATDRADSIVRAAEDEARRTLEAAEAKARALEADAAARAACQLAEIAERAEAELDVLVDARQKELVALALGIGEKLAGRAFQTDPSLVEGLVRDASAKLARGTSFRVRVSADDESRMRETFPAFAIVVDETLSIGEAIVESSIGRVDARIAVRLDAIRRALGLEGDS